LTAVARKWAYAWVAWIAAFLTIEVLALKNSAPGDTLSEHVWAVFSIKEKGNWWRARRFSLLAFMAWLVVHILTGGTY
jgi:hypothetical protein